MPMVKYPAKSRTTAVNKVSPARSDTAEVNKVTTTTAPMHGSAKPGKGLTNKRGLPKGK